MIVLINYLPIRTLPPFYIYANVIKAINNATHTLPYSFRKDTIFVSMEESDTLQKEFLELIGKNIREIRIRKGLSQAEVANRCGKERQSYQRVETGNINATVWYLQHIAQALEVDLKELVDVRFEKSVG